MPLSHSTFSNIMMSTFYKFEFELNKICFTLALSRNSESHDYNRYTFHFWTFKLPCTRVLTENTSTGRT